MHHYISKFIHLVSHPVDFFTSCNDDEAYLIEFYTITIRIAAVINFIVNILFWGTPLLFTSLGLIFILLLSRFVATIALWIHSAILDLLIQLMAGHKDRDATARIATYTSVVVLIPGVGVISHLVTVLWCILATIGIKTQFRLTWGRALAIALIPSILVTLLQAPIIL